MKSTILTALALAAVVATPALAGEAKLKKSEVPVPVLKTVSEKYPKAEMTGFDKEDENGKTEYEINLKIDGAKVEVSLDADGKLLGEERRIAQIDLPEAVTKGLAASKYAKAKFLRAEKVSETDKPAVYELLIKDGKAKRELTFSEAGEITKDEAPDEND